MKGDALTAYAISAARSPLFHLIYNFVLNLRIFFVLRTRIYVYTFPNDPKQMLYYETRENPRGIYMYSVLSSLCSKRFLEDWVLGFTPSKGMHYYIYICISVSLWWRANARNFRLYYPYWQYTDHFIFRFLSLLCLRSTLCLYIYIYVYIWNANSSH